MSVWLDQALAQAELSNDCLAEHRAKSLEALRATPWPTRKTEAWRYTPLLSLDNSIIDEPNDNLDYPSSPEGVELIELFFVNGKLQSDINVAVEGLTIASLDNLNDEQQAVAKIVCQSAKPSRHLFGMINDVLAKQGVLISVADGSDIKPIIRLVHLQNGGQSHVRHLIKLGQSAKISVIEEYRGEQSFVATSFSEFDLGDDAVLNHYRFGLQTGAAKALAGCHFNLANRSQMHSTLVSFGSVLSRLDVDINHAGEHALATQNAIYLLADKELFDLHSNVEHMQPHGTTEENVRGIIGDSAKAVFNGRIHIHRYAQKTLAELNNRNLLLTPKAEINTKPELEIYADDVKCAHGATVAELDNKALYYLRSRGVSEQDARIMLNFGFINELIEQMPAQPLCEWLQGELRTRFGALRTQLSVEG
ncbi:Fe-S cluster assembly protein SufD [Sessilibacter sp. MAH4]